MTGGQRRAGGSSIYWQDKSPSVGIAAEEVTLQKKQHSGSTVDGLNLQIGLNVKQFTRQNNIVTLDEEDRLWRKVWQVPHTPEPLTPFVSGWGKKVIEATNSK